MSASGEGSTEPQAVRQSASRPISRKPGAFFMSLLLFALMGNKGADKTRPYKESAKIVGNFLHSCHLIHPEGASMVTLQTVLRMERQTMVVLRRHGVSVPGEVAAFVHQPDIDPRRAGLAVVAADTAAYGIRGAEGADQGIIFLRVGGLKKSAGGAPPVPRCSCPEALSIRRGGPAHTAYILNRRRWSWSCVC